MEKEICESLQGNLNIVQKQMFRKWLLKAIDENDKDRFSECAYIIGKEWHVLRNVEKEEQDDFFEELWNNIDKIKAGTYQWNQSKFGAYSYESKICFLINPIHYKIIYDTQNKRSLKKIYKAKKIHKAIDKKNWQTTVEEYYKAEVDFVPQNNEEDINKIFTEDCKLWIKGKKKQKNKGK